MKKSNYYLLTFLIVFLSLHAKGGTTLHGTQADQYVKGAEKIILGENSNIPTLISFREGSRPIFGSPDLWLKLNFGMDAEFGMSLISSEPDQLGFTHYRYMQTYKGKKLDAAMWIVHTRNNYVVSMNGTLLSQVKAADVPAISESVALNYALKEIPANVYNQAYQVYLYCKNR